MLSHVALGVYLVLSACLAVGELRSTSAPVPSPSSRTQAESTPGQSTSSKGTSGNGSQAQDRVVPKPAVHGRVPEIQAAKPRGASHSANTAKVGGDTPSPSPVPEPKIFALVGIGLLMLSLLRRKAARHHG